jgi:8-oxo-dGTP pyrophosphatase MutT (NUDIX family)
MNKMKKRLLWKGQEYELEWFNAVDISDLKPVTQVYGFLFDKKGRLCIVKTKDMERWTLPGGGPEQEDKDWKDTLIRESIEEADIELDKNSVEMFGYIKASPISKNCEKGVHYLIRAFGIIEKINKQTEDPAVGFINERKFIPPEKFLDYINWGEMGELELNLALDKFKEYNENEKN